MHGMCVYSMCVCLYHSNEISSYLLTAKCVVRFSPSHFFPPSHFPPPSLFRSKGSGNHRKPRPWSRSPAQLTETLNPVPEGASPDGGPSPRGGGATGGPFAEEVEGPSFVEEGGADVVQAEGGGGEDGDDVGPHNTHNNNKNGEGDHAGDDEDHVGDKEHVSASRQASLAKYASDASDVQLFAAEASRLSALQEV